MKSYSDVIRDGWIGNVPPLDLGHLDGDPSNIKSSKP